MNSIVSTENNKLAIMSINNPKLMSVSNKDAHTVLTALNRMAGYVKNEEDRKNQQLGMNIRNRLKLKLKLRTRIY